VKSKAILFPKPNKIEIGEVDVPDDLRPTDVLVRTQHSGLSTGTERWLLTARFFRADSPIGGDRSFPLVPGYQKVGVVERVGEEVRAFRPGERVFCAYGRIQSGAVPRDETGAKGGHIHYSIQDQNQVISIPPDIDAKAVAGLVLAQVGWNGASRPEVMEGDLAVVVGDGLVGQYAAQRLRSRGARVLISGRKPFRLRLAERFSADRAHNQHESPLKTAVQDFKKDFPKKVNKEWEHPGWMSREESAIPDAREVDDAVGVDVVVDTTGSREAVRQQSGLLRHNGHLVLLGWYPEPENQFLEDWFHMRELSVYSTGAYRRKRLADTLVAISEGHMKPAELVTHHVPVEEAPRIYRDLVLEKKEDFLSVVFDWGS